LASIESTPEAFANVSPGFEEREPWGQIPRDGPNPERVRRLANPFRVKTLFDVMVPKVLASSNLGLKLANAFGVDSTPKSANAFGVNSTPKSANAFGVNSTPEVRERLRR